MDILKLASGLTCTAWTGSVRMPGIIPIGPKSLNYLCLVM